MNLKTEILSELWMLRQFDRVLALLKYCRVLLFFKSSLLYIEVWSERCKCQHIQKESLLKLDLSPVILCLIWLTSYEGLISNPFQLRGNKNAGLVVHESCYSCLLAETKNRVVEKVVVQFVQSTMSTLLVSVQQNNFKSFWNDRCFNPLIFCQCCTIFAPKYNTWILKYLVKYCCFWRISFWGPSASDDVILFRSSCLQER